MEPGLGRAELTGPGGAGGGEFTDSYLIQANGIALDAFGRIVAVGRADQDFGVFRLLDDGTLDTSFGTGGFASVDFFGGVDAASEVVIEPQPFDGIVVVGRASSGVSRRIGISGCYRASRCRCVDSAAKGADHHRGRMAKRPSAPGAGPCARPPRLLPFPRTTQTGAVAGAAPGCPPEARNGPTPGNGDTVER